MRVLLIDSDPVVLKTASNYLQNQQIDTVCASSAQQAVHMCDSARPDIVVVDTALTGHSGVEFLHEFKSYHDWHTIPVIVWSMQHMTPAQKTALTQLGAVDILYKPKTSLAQLTQRLQSLATIAA